ncbi:MAG: hypothetical protein M1358_13460, partial [Chloroflexi bacterium]|nr:hypothetical protein [Chloroflexota bacterium]
MEKSQVYQQKTPGFAGVTKDHALSGLVRVFENRPRLLTALLFFPGSFWMLLFVGAPLVAVFFFSFWTSGFRGLQPIYTLDNYRDVLLNATFWKITLWTFEVVAMLLVGVIILAYPASYAIWRIVKDEKWKLVIL